MGCRKRAAKHQLLRVTAIEGVCASTHYVLGEDVAAFEGELAGFTGAAAVGCASGTDALWLALVVAGVQPGDSVAQFCVLAGEGRFVDLLEQPQVEQPVLLLT